MASALVARTGASKRTTPSCARPLDERVEQPGAHAAALPVVGDHDGRLSRALAGAHEAGHPHALPAGVKRHQRLMIVVVDLGQVVEVALAQRGHRPEEAPVAGFGRKSLEAVAQPVAVLGANGADLDPAAIGQAGGDGAITHGPIMGEWTSSIRAPGRRVGRRRERGVVVEALSAQDASFLDVEDDVTHMHIGSVGIFEGPPPSREDLVEAVAAKLPLVPRYRQRVRFPPLRLGPPVWVDDSHFNIDYHVRRTALASPGGEPELRTFVGRVMSQQLDRAKPLWEMWVAEGLSGGRWALISKTHHCMVDGVSATDLLSVMLDAEREPRRDPVPRWSPAPEPNAAELVAQPLARRLVSPLSAVEATRTALAAPRQMAELALSTARGTAAMRGLLRPGPSSSLNGPIGPHRRWDWAHAQLSDVRTVRTGLGGTVNDVVLTAITRGFRDLLAHRGEQLDGRTVRTLVPVSVRRPGERGTYNNRVSAMFAELPVGCEDPRRCLDTVRVQMDALKRSQQAVAGEVLTSLSGFAPSLLLALGTRVAARLPQRSVNTVTTNVPGPQQPLFLTGRRLLEAIPFVPVGGQVRVGVAIFSYDGALKFGVTGDYDTAPDIDVLCAGIERGMTELVAAAGDGGGPAAGERRPRSKSVSSHR